MDKDEEESNKASEVFRERFNNIDAINAALRKIKYRRDQKLSQYLITEDDIGKISTLNKFLTKLDIFSTTLGGDKFVTSSIVFPVMAAMKKLLKPDNSDPVYIAKLKEVILEDFVKRANSNIDGNFLLLATALDPRWKDLKVITKESRERAFGRLKKEMMSLQPSTSSGTEQEQESKPKKRLLDFDASDESIEEEDELDAELSRLLIDKLSICNLQLFACRYRKEPILEESEDPLDWWRQRRPQFPTLWRLARKFLCVPATSTQAERVFSWMGFLLNKRRLSLSGESVSMQLFLKDNLEL